MCAFTFILVILKMLTNVTFTNDMHLQLAPRIKKKEGAGTLLLQFHKRI